MSLSRQMRLGLRMALQKGDGWLYRWPGGYWLPQPYKDDGPLVADAPDPDAPTTADGGRQWIGTQTVAALEARGLLETRPGEESRRKYARRRLTDSGRAAAEEMTK